MPTNNRKPTAPETSTTPPAADRADYARRLAAALLKAYATRVRVCAGSDLSYSIGKLTMSREAASLAVDAWQTRVDRAVARTGSLEEKMIRLIFGLTGWRPDPTPGNGDPEEWPCPAVSIGGVLWAARVTDLGLTHQVQLIRVELPKVVDLDGPKGGGARAGPAPGRSGGGAFGDVITG